jgi:nucleoside-diphosphate-sugar epimerase
MDILISGTTGFVGVNLVEYLKAEHHCHPLDLRKSVEIPHYPNSVLIHLAGKAHDLKKLASKEEYLQANFELTKKVFDGFLLSDTKKFIFSSSIKAVADKVTGELTEESLAIPNTPYGESKLLAEQYILSKKLPPGKSVFILRPCMIHGRGNKGNLTLLFKLIKNGIPYPLGAFNNKRSFLYIENLCFIINELISNDDIASGIYNVSDDLPLSTTRVIEIIADELSKKPAIWKVNQSLVEWGARMGDLFHLPLNSERLQKLTEDYVLSNNKIIKAIGKPLPVTSEEGLHKTIQSFIHGV